MNPWTNSAQFSGQSFKPRVEGKRQQSVDSDDDLAFMLNNSQKQESNIRQYFSNKQFVPQQSSQQTGSVNQDYFCESLFTVIDDIDSHSQFK